VEGGGGDCRATSLFGEVLCVPLTVTCRVKVFLGKKKAPGPHYRGGGVRIWWEKDAGKGENR